MPRLFHLSEERNIPTFNPRISKKQWNYKKYVWAIAEEKLHNYFLPRACPRICVGLEESTILSNWLNKTTIKHKKALIFVPDEWQEKIQECTLFKYEFNDRNFKLIDQIAGYYVSDKIEIPISKVEIKNCIQELHNLNIELIIMDKEKMKKIKEFVVNNLKEFSIIKWSNFE